MKSHSETKVVLRKADASDIPVLLKIGVGVTSKTYVPVATKEGWEGELAKQNAAVYLILAEGSVAGFVSREEREDSFYISELAIRPNFQRMGIGRKAMRLLLADLPANKTVTLVTHPENVGAVRLYESVGFITTSRIENFYGDGEPRISMVKKS